MLNQITIQTPEDVKLNYDIAGPGSRIAAGLIDLTIIWSTIAGIVVLMLSTGAISISLVDVVDGKLPAQIGMTTLILLLGSIFVLNIGYFIFFEWMTNGQSIGKRAVGLRVVHDGGQALSPSASFIRNVSRVVDFLPGPYVVGLLSALISSKGQRIGDFIAGTIVIRHEAASMPKRPFAGLNYSGLQNAHYSFGNEELGQLGPKGFQILDEYFQRCDQLDADLRDQLERSVSDNLQQHVGLSKFSVDDHHRSLFLKELYLALREHLGV